MLTITLSELMSDVQVTQARMDGRLEKSGEAQRLQNSLKQMASYSKDLLRDCGLPEDTLEAKLDNEDEDLWRWSEISDLSETLAEISDLSEILLMGITVMGRSCSMCRCRGWCCYAGNCNNLMSLRDFLSDF